VSYRATEFLNKDGRFPQNPPQKPIAANIFPPAGVAGQDKHESGDTEAQR